VRGQEAYIIVTSSWNRFPSGSRRCPCDRAKWRRRARAHDICGAGLTALDHVVGDDLRHSAHLCAHDEQTAAGSFIESRIAMQNASVKLQLR
jgi:hypothetical protein